MSKSDELSRNPTPDRAEENAWFPSPYSLSQYIPPLTDFDGADYAKPHQGGKKILMVATDERYVLMKNGTMFSSGNHPVETMLPMMHLDKAGFEIEVTTLSGNPVKFEMWAMPSQDEAVKAFYARYLPKFKQPKKLADVLAEMTEDEDYSTGARRRGRRRRGARPEPGFRPWRQGSPRHPHRSTRAQRRRCPWRAGPAPGSGRRRRTDPAAGHGSSPSPHSR